MWGILLLGGAVIITVWWAVRLVLVDETQRRLPDHLTLPAALGAGTGALLTEPVLILGGLAWAGAYLLGRGIGGGDVKLALSLGVLAAAAGGVIGVLAAVVAASAVTVVRSVLRRGKAVPHGPSMLVGTFIVVLYDTWQGALSHLGGAS
ncbi:prepilin peptidase [Corynebacterium hylobatis]|uniref:prepilin peptidase n=1 Tax=Corynebacterium hylobatis TaxID=1859290 RepID=UPI001F493069|nr:prepilin peptidase [Corynebacterium hylobatis]